MNLSYSQQQMGIHSASVCICRWQKHLSSTSQLLIVSLTSVISQTVCESACVWQLSCLWEVGMSVGVLKHALVYQNASSAEQWWVILDRALELVFIECRSTLSEPLTAWSDSSSVNMTRILLYNIKV